MCFENAGHGRGKLCSENAGLVMKLNRLVALLPLLGQRGLGSQCSLSTVRSTAASGSNVYESSRAVHEYLLFHYGNDEDIMPYDFGPKQALHFNQRSASICNKYASKGSQRALDIGCAVGGSSFELAKYYQQVVGIDFSHKFIEAANEMKVNGVVDYTVLKQGSVYMNRTSILDEAIDRNRVQFMQGDACNMSTSLDTFDVILGSNLLCRLPDPRKFLRDIPRYLKSDGILVLISPYSWLEEYTKQSNWVGAANNQDSFHVLKDEMKRNKLQLIHQEDIPFIIREHERKFQYGVSDLTIWKKHD